MFQQHVAETETLSRGVDVQREDLRDRALRLVQTVGGVEGHGEHVIRTPDALGVDDRVHRAVGLDDELTYGIGDKAPPDDFSGDAQRLGPAQLFKFKKSRYVGETGMPNEIIALLNHVCVRPRPPCPVLPTVEQLPASLPVDSYHATLRHELIKCQASILHASSVITGSACPDFTVIRGQVDASCEDGAMSRWPHRLKTLPH
ncbi:hypothetical protein ACWDRL_28880 [Streptomyces albidoflavus]